MQNNITKIQQSECTGCGACFNICPVNAISMQENNEGFLYPVIDEDKCTNCGLCAKRCPILSERKNSNKKAPECYAVMAKDEIRSMSSSGGMFTLLADYILEQGGYVCGAAYNNDWSVSHIIVDNKKDLSKLRGSKYLQSNTEKCYTEIKKLLQNNKKVLFTGCPCQVAGLYGYLGRDYENLLTMELLCHGTPSYKTFKKYLNETFPGEDIERIEFRDKSLTWCCTKLAIYHAAGGISIMDYKDDPYEKGFHRGLFNRESCAPCEFARLPRQADFTVADWWGINKIKPEYDDKKGTSLVLTNNPKAEKIFDIIKTNMQKICSIPLEDAKKSVNVTIYRPLKHNAGRKTFFRNFDNYSIKESVEMALENKFDVGIIGLFAENNYGCILTGYALYKLVQELGYSTAFIDRRFKNKNYDINTMARKFLQKHNVITCYDNETDILNKYFKTFLCGSDQLWNYCLDLFRSKYYLLDFALNNKRKIAYATSFGEKFYTYNNFNELNICKYLFQRFNKISVREDYATDILKNQLGIDSSTQVLDPVFVCNPQIYSKLAESSKFQTENDYIFAYILDPTPEKMKILEYTAQQLNKKLYVATDADNNKKKQKLITTGNILGQIELEDWLKLYQNASYIVTDSFHGTCFSIIFEKQFISIGNTSRGISRFYSLLKTFNLMDKLCLNCQDIIDKNMLFSTIDYEKINQNISATKTFSKDWLKNALIEPVNENISEYDFLRINNQKMRNEVCYYSQHLPKEKYYKFKYLYYRLIYNISFGKFKEQIKKKKLKYKDRLTKIKTFKQKI